MHLPPPPEICQLKFRCLKDRATRFRQHRQEVDSSELRIGNGVIASFCTGFAPAKGKTTLAYAPHCPVPREERWYAVLADSPKNAVLSWMPISLMEAEKAGVEAAKRAKVSKATAESGTAKNTNGTTGQ